MLKYEETQMGYRVVDDAGATVVQVTTMQVEEYWETVQSERGPVKVHRQRLLPLARDNWRYEFSGRAASEAEMKALLAHKPKAKSESPQPE